MSPQDKVERVLKEIHMAFAKSEALDDQPDKLVVDRRQFLDLLDRLNHGMYELFEQYEQTRQSRENAEREVRKKNDRMVSDASRRAEDVYAASVIYTEDMIGQIRELMDQTNESMNDLFRDFRKDLRQQKDKLKSHEAELQNQLADMAETGKYLKIIENMNREKERLKREAEAEKTAGRQRGRRPSWKNQADTEETAGSGENLQKIPAAAQPGQEESDGQETAGAALQMEKPDVRINTNAAYFKWKASQGQQDDETDEIQALNGQQDDSSDEKASDDKSSEQTAVSDTEAEIKKLEKELDEGEPFPNEEAILQAVLQDEMESFEAEGEPSDSTEESEKPSGIDSAEIMNKIKNFVFGNDLKQ